MEVKTTNSNTFYVTGSCPSGNLNVNCRSVASSPSPCSQVPCTSHLDHKGYRIQYCSSPKCNTDRNQNIQLPTMVNAGNQTSPTTPDKPITSIVPFDYSSLPPPPEYPGRRQATTATTSSEQTVLSRSYEVLEKTHNSATRTTRSQPDLTRRIASQTKVVNIGNVEGVISSDVTKDNSLMPLSLELDNAAIATRATQMVDMLTDENRKLRKELDTYFKKVSKLQKFEIEIQKVHESHESLVRSSQKRESLEKAMRNKMELEIKRLKEGNKALKDQLEKSLSQLHAKVDTSVSVKDSDLQKEVSKKDSIITKLISQNKELMSSKERTEIELAAHRSTLQEQRTHIDVLDNALTNAQANLVRLDDECRKKQIYADRVEHLQQALTSLQMACEKREQLQDKLKSKLEQEVHLLRIQCGQAEKTGSQNSVSEASTDDLRRLLIQKDEKILELESEMIKWEQRYLEEGAMRQLAVDTASVPKEARIAALEQSSAESERQIAEARSERMKHLEEVYQANRRAAELETKVKSLHAQLAEKDAMIRVLQQHSFSHSSTSSLYSTVHVPRVSYTTLPMSSSLHASHNEVKEPNQSAHNRSNSQGDEKQINNPGGDNLTLQQMLLLKNLKLSESASTDHVSSHLWQV